MLKFSDLRNPEKLLRQFGGPVMTELLKAGGFPLGSTHKTDLTLGLQWEARHDWMKLGQTRMRVYRLQARLFDRFDAVVLVSHVGEILRIELPDQVEFKNEALNL